MNHRRLFLYAADRSFCLRLNFVFFPMSYHIDIPSVAEYPALVVLWEASVRATHHFLSEEDLIFFRKMIAEQYLHLVRLHCIRNTEGHILGFSGAAEGNLEMLFLDPAARGQGIGKQLLEHAIREQHITKVDVNEQNEQAIGFYEHCGFRIVSRSPLDGTGKPYPILHMELGK